ncbi:hypothetical protein MY55_19850 [Chromobacterium subtsugae]|nr:hypothetical protein MY55_19850 [Chromobacterium subtsugae]
MLPLLEKMFAGQSFTDPLVSLTEARPSACRWTGNSCRRAARPCRRFRFKRLDFRFFLQEQ